MITEERLKNLINKEFGMVSLCRILPSSQDLYIKIFAQVGYMKFNGKYLWKC